MRCLLPLLILSFGAQAAEVIVHDVKALKAALPLLKDGDTLKIAPGEYPGGHSVRGIAGLTVEALDSSQPPRFVGARRAGSSPAAKASTCATSSSAAKPRTV